jgi:hypothetical protein
MRKVLVTYNPFFYHCRIRIGDAACDPETNRFAAYVARRPMAEWLPRRRDGYSVWRGFFAELAREANDIALEIAFYGAAADFERFAEAFADQRDAVGAAGYASTQWTVSHTDTYEPEQVKTSLDTFLARAIGYATPRETERLARMRAALAAADGTDGLRDQMLCLKEYLTSLCEEPNGGWSLYAAELERLLK